MKLNRYPKCKLTGIAWLPEVPEGWECCRIKQVLIANDGGVWGSDPLDERDTIVLRSTEQDVDGTLKVVSPARRHLSESEICKALLKEGDLIITKSSGSEEHIGKTSLIDKATADLQCCYSNFLQRLRVNGEASSHLSLTKSDRRSKTRTSPLLLTRRIRVRTERWRPVWRRASRAMRSS